MLFVLLYSWDLKIDNTRPLVQRHQIFWMCDRLPVIFLIKENYFIILSCAKHIAISNHQKIRISKSEM